MLYSSASLFRIEEVMSPDVHLGLVTFGLTVVDSWTEPGFLRAGWACSALISLSTLKRSSRVILSSI